MKNKTPMQHQLDCKHLFCPMPIIRLQNKVSECQTGDLVEIFCTDPGVVQDIPAWCRTSGHTVVKAYQQGDLYITLIRVEKS